MKLTKQIKAELANAYQCALEVSILNMKAPLRYINLYIAENVSGFGTAADEKVQSRADYRKMVMAGRQQSKGMAFKARIISPYRPKFIDETTAQFRDEVVVQIGDKKNNHILHLWFSTLFKYQHNKWQLVMFHGSMPDAGSTTEDTFHVAEAEKKLRDLEQIIAQRTTDLKIKNRELEIEASLEKVRAVAMGMKEREDMLKICTMIAKQLSVLGLKEIRNVQTAIFKVPMGTYVNYEFYAKHDKTFITETLYTNHKVALAFAKTMLKGKGAVAIKHFRGKEKVMDWLRYQKGTNVFIDTYLKKATSLSYYWYSLGPVALGISTYQQLTKEELQLFERFLKVFELAYKRYLDIEKAEAQTREAQIEAALERIRARSMAMQDSSEIGKLILHVYTELTRLDARLDRCFFMIVDPENLGITWWMASQEGLLAENGFFVQYNEHPSHLLYLDHWKNRTKKWHYLFAGKEKRDWDRFGFTKTALSRLPEPVKKFMSAAKSVHLSGSSDAFGSLVTGSFEPLSDEHQEIISRFATVFNQTYTRFLDLQKAEAQTREAQIEAALERVRSRTMGMQKSEELKEVIQIVYDQLVLLKLPLEHTGFILDYQNRNDFDSWIADHLGSPSNIVIPYFPALYYDRFNAAKKEGEQFFALNLTKKEKDQFYRKLFKHLPGFPEASKAFLLQQPALTISTTLLDDIALYIENFSGIPYTEQENDILMRFAKVFQQTYTRFLDLQKAEAQTREAQIEAALEKVRSRSLAMHQSEELQQVVNVVFEKIMDLGVPINSASIIVLSEIGDEMEYWVGVPGQVYLSYLRIPYFDDTQIARDFIMARQKGQIFNKCYNGPEKNEQWTYLFNHSDLSKVSDERKQFLLATEAYNVSVIFTKNTALQLLRYDAQLFTEKENEIFQRFANVFEQAYIRFLDLKKAEAQARESQIEAALERVRSRAMSMHSSGELNEVVRELRKQMGLLGQKDLETCVIHLHDESPEFIHSWAAIKPPEMEGEILETTAIVPKKGLLIIEESLKAYASQQQDYIIVNEGEKLRQWFAFLKDASPDGYHKLIESVQGQIEELRAFWSFADFTGGSLLTVTMQQPDEATRELLRRFANVFGLAYRRFADLQKAEIQAREGQIQLALERARAQSMMMQYSNELDDTLRVFHEQVLQLGIPSAFSFLWLPDEEKERHIFWAAWEEHQRFESKAINYPLDRNEPATLQCLIDWKSKSVVAYHVPPEGVENYFSVWSELVGNVEHLKSSNFREGLYYVEAFNKYGCFGVLVKEDLDDDEKKILYRFAAEFEQTYTRFLDLQKAEAQAKEAQIEAALEKVRSRTMAMQSSNELQETAAVLFEEFKKLGNEEIYQVTIGTYKEEEQMIDFRVTDWAGSGQQELRTFQLDMNEPTLLQPAVTAWREGKKSAVFDLTGDRLQGWLDYRNQISGITMRSQDTSGRRVISTAYFSKGHLSLSSPLPLANDTIKTLERFAAVFDGTYTRFVDLEKAEVQAREAQIEAALEKVRSRTLAMQKSDELSDTAAELFRQMIGLGIEPNRLYIGLVNPETRDMEMWATDEQGTGVGKKFNFNAADNASVRKLYDGWATKEKSVTVDMQGKELEEYIRYLQQLNIPLSHALTQKRRVQSVAYFDKGFIGMASPDEQSEKNIQLLERFAAVFNLTFTRFNDLQLAEAHAAQAELDLIAIKEAKQKAEEALTELQTTQKQLIQAEKMASLGELTAGIAHEIQNPLNFVNNFSEVSKELLDEIKEELEKGNLEDAKELMQDVIRNLEKINHHGKRADSIVKGMLQHSRSGSGQMEPTDINALCDEYLRLSYHGLRAKDKSFNARFETHFDSSIGKINVLPQDLGRVILNLINNAFYAVAERKKLGEAGYEPTVEVQTTLSPLPGRGVGGEVTIIVKDNGVGIPPSILDKIFQPFFTTKPTGQGTGLGLSLSYDIVKAHGGVLKVETKEGEGTSFMILLPGIK